MPFNEPLGAQLEMQGTHISQKLDSTPFWVTEWHTGRMHDVTERSRVLCSI